MSATTPVSYKPPAGYTLANVPASDRIVGIANYSTTFVVATEHGVYRFNATDGVLHAVPFVVPAA